MMRKAVEIYSDATNAAVLRHLQDSLAHHKTLVVEHFIGLLFCEQPL